MILLLALGGSSAQAQTRPGANAPAPGPESPATANLQGVPGVKAGMSSDQLIDQALQLAQDRKWEDARKILTEVIRQEPRNVRAYQVAAQLFEIHASAAGSDTSDPDAAQKSDSLINQAVKTYLDYVASIAMELNDLQTAEQAYRAVLQHERFRYNPQALLGMARVAAARSSLQAIDRYKTYINPRICPIGAKDAQAHLELGRIYRDRGYLNQAVSTLEKAQGLDPESPDILLALARAYQASSRFKSKAIEVARKAVSKAPRNAAYRNVHAQILLAHVSFLIEAGGGITAEARSRFDEARKESTEAVRLARADVQASPNDPQRLRTLLTCFTTQQQVLDAATRLNGSDVTALVELAHCRDEMAAVQHTLALRRIVDNLLAAPDSARNSPAYLETLADLQTRVYDFSKAAETARQLLKIDPANATGRRILEQVAKEESGKSGNNATAPAVSAR